MDSRSDFLKDFIRWISDMDGEYLIGVSNRGIYNRSVKDLSDSPSINVSIGEDAVICTLPDGNVCTLVSDIKKYKCTCPSRSVCKHVIMALLHLKQNAEGLFGELADACRENVEISGGENFYELLEIDPQEIRRLVGDRSFEEILFRASFGMKVEIEEATFLTVNFKEEDVAVRFPKKEPMENSICSCKSREFCSHRAEAILYFQMEKGKLDAVKLRRGQEILVPMDTVADIKNFIADTLVLGLSRLSETSIEGMEQMAVICHNAGFANIEKLFRRVKGEAELYFRKDARFSRGHMLNALTNIWSLCVAIQENKDNADLMETLVGQHKSAYHGIPPIELYGMGAEGWTSKAGYEGITFYFYNARLGRWLAYSNSRPTYYEESNVNVSRMYKGSPPWGIEGGLETFSKSKIKLVNGKMNEEGRLSSSSETLGKILQRTDTTEESLKDIVYTDWRIVLEKLKKEFDLASMVKEGNPNVFLLKASKWGQSSFDSIKQIFKLPICDVEGRELFISLSYSQENKRLIQKLEFFERTQDFPEMILGKIFIEDESLMVIPISGYSSEGDIVNLILD